MSKNPCGASNTQRRGSFLLWRNEHLIDVVEINKGIDVENLKILLHEQAANPPQFNPFTASGNHAWAEWCEGCREIERQLEAAGVAL